MFFFEPNNFCLFDLYEFINCHTALQHVSRFIEPALYDLMNMRTIFLDLGKLALYARNESSQIYKVNDGSINSFDTESNIQFSSMLGLGSGIEE